MIWRWEAIASQNEMSTEGQSEPTKDNRFLSYTLAFLCPLMDKRRKLQLQLMHQKVGNKRLDTEPTNTCLI